MNDSLLTTAMLGTERQGTPFETVPETDGLLNQMPEMGRERELLFAAGALAVFRQAGTLPQAASSLPIPASGETLPAGSPQVRALVRDLLKEAPARIVQAMFERMERAGIRLSHDVLPDALNVAGPEVRLALLPVLGERGLWLARFDSAWDWVATLALERSGDGLPPDAETIWQEGTLAPRVKLVIMHRRLDPAGALERVQGVFPSEGADARAKLVSALETGLSPIDEPFLEQALDDRSDAVRREAAALLARLPESAFVGRMRRRAEDMLHMSSSRRLLAAQQTLEVTTPDELDQSWKRDRLEKKPQIVPYDTWFWRVRQIVGSVPVRYWLDRFEVTMDDLLQAANDEWCPVLLEGWTNAALLYKEVELMPALWDAWLPRIGSVTAHQQLVGLTRSMSPAELQPRLVNLLQVRRQDRGVWYWVVLEAAPKPWGLQFADAYMNMLSKAVGVSGKKPDGEQLLFLLWHEPGIGAPDAMIDRGLALLSLVSGPPAVPHETWQRLLNVQKEWQMRQRIMEALPE